MNMSSQSNEVVWIYNIDKKGTLFSVISIKDTISRWKTITDHK